ncbi:ParA family protein [Agrobacterium larrymoorei]|uniref:ParA family protein n=1 Tax=Agrobacterium larrymoorei TaxID=160699 RepID=A0A4D7DN49_9HYPH|nr:ParA family protein [Agrobacterium larrymoorei]QCI98843.1 ParA family protein [Agrobacterium larrymoorei]QYA08269.1 ParA family protein [Agrobacterium larrymoorei]
MTELYTYLDLLDRLRDDETVRSAPPEVLRAQPLPSRLALYLLPQATLEPVKTWLRQVFGPRFLEGELAIALEPTSSGSPRVVPVEFERVDEDWKSGQRLRLRPTLMSGSVVVYNMPYEVAETDDLGDCPPVLTFHSFKGGMGRTTLALALSSAVQKSHGRVLFIDADFEAPGISSLLKHSMPNPRIAFADLLAIASTSLEIEANDAIEIVASRLADQDIDGLTVLPCTRDLGLPSVSPESLTVSGKRSPFFVGSLVARLGKKMGADLVIVDLRAGLSELVASLFLDPRLQHVLVSTLNGQAIDGTIMLLERMREMAAKWRGASNTRFDASLPTVIINQSPPGLKDAGFGQESALNAMSAFEEEIRLFLAQLASSDENDDQHGNPFQEASITTSVVDAEPTVTILPRDLREALRSLAKTTLPDQMHSIFGSLLPAPQSLDSKHHGVLADAKARRENLAEYAKRSIFAESKPQAEIYPTASLVNLAERHQSTPPTVTVIGEKGSGKSYTFMSLALSKTWGNFIQKLGVEYSQDNRTTGALVLPVTPPQDLDLKAREEERRVTSDAAAALTGGIPLNDQVIADAVQDQLQRPDAGSAVAWREFWLDMIAWRAGFQTGKPNAFGPFIDSLQPGQAVVGIFDGVETLFSKLRTSVEEQAAVEALLRLVPDWLSQLPAKSVGCVIFVREDLARYAMVNNYKQFADRYSAFALRWNWAEASALALWVAEQAGSLSSTIAPESLATLDEEQRSQALVELWGWKMGPNTSREARSLEWTMSSLSDFNRSIKARDLVRFLAESASRSTPSDVYYDQRLLSPRAMRDAIGPCSKERVSETGEENVDLKRIFRKIEDLVGNQRELPWSFERAHELLGGEDLRVLEDNGVLFRYGDEFFVPELYRSGLNLFYSGGARRKVVTLMRQAAGRAH